jgi:resuscitation-promoting factor RpfA
MQTKVNGRQEDLPVTHLRRTAPPLLALAAAAGGARVLAWATAQPVRAARAGAATYDDLLASAVAAAAWTAFGYLVLVLAATSLGALPGAVGRACQAVAEAVTPAACRQVARLAVGLTVAAGGVTSTVPAAAAAGADRAAVPAAVAEPAAATTADADPAAHPGLSALPAIGRPGQVGGWVPEVPSATAGPATPARLVAAAPRDAETVTDEVVVRRGDSLWRVAERALGPDATDAEIATEWPRWYDANRDVVGDDPDLLLPGTVLRPPSQA